MIPQPLVIAAGQLTGLIIAADVAEGIETVQGVVPEITVVGAVVIAIRFLNKAYKDGLAVYEKSSILSSDMLTAERAAFAAREATYLARIAALEQLLHDSD